MKKIALQDIIIKYKNVINAKEEDIINMATREKNVWILILFILCGIVVGGLLGELASQVDFLWWLSYGEEFGISDPITLDLQVITLTFGLMFKINIASIIGMILAIFIYRKI